MAHKKLVRRVASKPASKKPSAKIKKTVASKPAARKKAGKTSAVLGKKKVAPKITSGKKTVGPKKTVATKAKPASSKGVSAKQPALKKTPTKRRKVVKAVSKPTAKKPTAPKLPTLKKKASVVKKTIVAPQPSVSKSVVTKKEYSVSQKEIVPAQAKNPQAPTPSRSVPSPTRSAETKTGGEPLSPTERYNLGGLFVCAIERANDPECKRLRAVLRHLDLPSQEKDNLLRLSQGFTIPKLFADGVGGDKVRQILTDFIRFALAEGAYEKKWRDEIRQVGVWLGYFPQQFEQIEQKVLAKR
jgi:hypothetical protein